MAKISYFHVSNIKKNCVWLNEIENPLFSKQIINTIVCLFCKVSFHSVRNSQGINFQMLSIFKSNIICLFENAGEKLLKIYISKMQNENIFHNCTTNIPENINQYFHLIS